MTIIHGMIKRKQSDVAGIVLEILAKKKFLLFYTVFRVGKLLITL